jgi:hypothetical protein
MHVLKRYLDDIIHPATLLGVGQPTENIILSTVQLMSFIIEQVTIKENQVIIKDIHPY